MRPIRVMLRGRARQPSLRRSVMARMLVPAGTLALVLGAGGALLIQNFVEATNDRLLDGSVLAIADRLAIDEDGAVTVDLPRVALQILEGQSQDRIFYRISYNGNLVTGYPDLPLPPRSVINMGSQHWNTEMRGELVRVASLARRIYGKPEPVLVEVAETRNARRTLEWRLLGGLAVLEAGLLGLVLWLAWGAIGRGLEPLNQLSAEINRRVVPGAINLQPLDASLVPAETLAPVLAFNTLLQRLEQAMSAVRRFTADASHQIRTPLAALRINVDLARRHVDATDAVASRAAFDDIEGAARRLEHLLSQLIALARADEVSPGETFSIAPLDLAEVAATVVAEQVPRAVASCVDLQFERPEGAVPVLGHKLLVGEIIGNLLDNAIRYSPQGGTVVVRVGLYAEGGRAEVEDQGPGIPAPERAKAFERFYRVPRKEGPEGSGLGLAIVRALADRLGAAVTLDDRIRGPGLVARVVFRRASSAKQ